MGAYTDASGDYSTAMGYRTTASGGYSTAMGRSTTASGMYSTAMGRRITAQGHYSFGIGLDDTARTITQSNTMAIMGGDVGIGTTSPTSKLHVIGKATITGGVDPPYVSFSDETHESIREFAKNVEGHEKVMQFWNGKAHRMEVYVISEDKFYTITGELVEE
ncbi:Head domain of trimeric autotransporter adhesin [Candidatus Methanophagaceae archaeon]|nr:Head domain of trimeric autotransporter adhesin [Methanophagales archaeon]